MLKNVPRPDHGLTGATSISRRTRDGASAAANIATPPPCDVPNKSQESIPTESMKRKIRSALARNEQSKPGGYSENPAPGRSTANTCE